MNKVIMMGRLTRDPEVRATNTGSTVVSYSLAVNRRFKREGDPEADFFNCIVFGKGAEFAEKYLKKGMQILIEGRLQNNNYTNKQGEKVYGMQVVVESQEFTESKGGNNGGQAPAPAQDTAPAEPGDGFMNIPDGMEDELPWA